VLQFAAVYGAQQETQGGVDSLPRDDKLYAWPCGSFERAAVNELVAQLVEQRPFNPILPIKSKIKRNSDIHNYHAYFQLDNL
jgi:hypothetical protein